METTITKLQKLQQSVGKLETVLQEVWECIDDIGEDDEFSEMMDNVEQNKSQSQVTNEKVEDLGTILTEFQEFMGGIPEDGTVVVSFEQSISELIEWFKNNK